MRHAREDYNRIQDPEGRIPRDEPVFLLRGQDICAAAAVRHYATLVRVAAPLGRETEAQRIADAAEEHAARMDAWPRKKSPDMPREARPMGSKAQEADVIAALLDGIKARADAVKVRDELAAAVCREAILKGEIAALRRDTNPGKFRWRLIFDAEQPDAGVEVFLVGRPGFGYSSRPLVGFRNEGGEWTVFTPLAETIPVTMLDRWLWCPIPDTKDTKPLAAGGLVGDRDGGRVSLDERLRALAQSPTAGPFKAPTGSKTVVVEVRGEGPGDGRGGGRDEAPPTPELNLTEFAETLAGALYVTGLREQASGSRADFVRSAVPLLKPAILAAILHERKRCAQTAGAHAHHALWAEAFCYQWDKAEEDAIIKIAGIIRKAIEERPNQQ